MVFRAGIQKTFVRIANMEEPGQTDSSDLGLPSFSRHFWQTISVQNFYNIDYLLGLVSGATRISPSSAATLWAQALVTKFCSVQVNPSIKKHKLMILNPCTQPQF